MVPATFRTHARITSAALGALIGCTAQEDAGSGIRVETTDSAGIAIVSISGDVHDLPEWSLAAEPLAVIGDQPPLLGRVGEVALLSDGRVLVEDQQAAELHLFDESGAVIRLVGARGDGPGEFQNLTVLTVAPGDTVHAFDRRLYRVSTYDRDGNLIRSLGVPRDPGAPRSLFSDVWAGLDSDHLVALGQEEASNAPPTSEVYRDERNALLRVLDGAGIEGVPSVRFAGGYTVSGRFGEMLGTAVPPLTNRPFVDVNFGRILNGSGLTYELTFRNADLEPTRMVRWSGWEQPLTEDLLGPIRDSVFASADERRAESAELAALIESPFRPELLPAALPALGTAMQDEEGWIWVQRFLPTTELWSGEDAWHVLDPEGTPVGRVRLPSHAQLAFVRRDRVAMIVRDSLDVEQVQVFQLQRGG